MLQRKRQTKVAQPPDHTAVRLPVRLFDGRSRDFPQRIDAVRECKQLREQIGGSPMLSEMIERGRLKVVALYPDEDLAEWREYRGHIPPSWINGYDAGCVVREKSLYDLHAIPALYLLDRDKRVLVKDSTDVPYIEEVIDRRG